MNRKYRVLFLLLILHICKAHAEYRAEFYITIQNKTSENLTLYGWELTHGDASKSFVTYVFKPGDVNVCHFVSSLYTGVEGTLKFFCKGLADRIIIHYDNPLIGKSSYDFTVRAPFTGNVVSWDHDKHILNVEITEMQPSVAPIDLSYDTRGVISGTVFWEKGNIKGPEIFPAYKPFEMKAYAPTQFLPGASAGAGIKGIYQNKQGLFTGSAPAGSIFYTIDSMDASYYKISYTVSNIPVGVPLQFDITVNMDVAKWLPGVNKINRPDSSYFFVVGTFPATSGATISLSGNFLTAKGVDFQCEGDWLKVDENGNVITGNAFANKIQNRKNAVVLPAEMLAVSATGINAVQAIQAPGLQNSNQNKQTQKVRTQQTIRVRN